MDTLDMFLLFDKKFIKFLNHNRYWLIQSKEELYKHKKWLDRHCKAHCRDASIILKRICNCITSSKKLSSEHLTSTSSPPAKGQVKRPVKHTWAKKASWGASRMHTEMLHIWYAHVRIQTKRINKSITNSDMICIHIMTYMYNIIYTYICMRKCRYTYHMYVVYVYIIYSICRWRKGHPSDRARNTLSTKSRCRWGHPHYSYIHWNTCHL